jgi:hypothetical protein
LVAQISIVFEGAQILYFDNVESKLAEESPCFVARPAALFAVVFDHGVEDDGHPGVLH